MKFSPRTRLLLVAILGLVAGWSIWSFSPYFTGTKEPWDGSNFYFPVALFLSGLLISCLAPRYFWAVPIGLYFGQLAFMLLCLGSGPLIVLGIVFLAIYTLIGLAGAVIPFGIRALVMKRRPS